MVIPSDKVDDNMDDVSDAEFKPSYQTSSAMSFEPEINSQQLVMSCKKPQRMQYILDMIHDPSVYSEGVLRRAADGVHGGLTSREADELKQLAFELVQAGVVYSRIGKGTVLSKLCRELNRRQV